LTIELSGEFRVMLLKSTHILAWNGGNAKRLTNQLYLTMRRLQPGCILGVLPDLQGFQNFAGLKIYVRLDLQGF